MMKYIYMYEETNRGRQGMCW